MCVVFRVVTDDVCVVFRMVCVVFSMVTVDMCCVQDGDC